ncbi:DoxX family protein [Aurantiacibacter gangjinensis]|uniref:LysR family transcriptional regulator n=1 Tax=Aurantiacibacter gangjinensis TaxID=502682 RepID=A0A0G9MN04_9SPHN|nr:DoxX family protein [Aurantiacibacter gangjinensis]APE28079.1 putative membrane protein [Aurantiacibacter gangjinensis]KLE32004.1 LysR family transcriptional regulator [Aurantiacibacter gangjinensis]
MNTIADNIADIPAADGASRADMAALAGRALLALLFILAGVNKLMDPAGTIGFIEFVGLPLPQFAYAGTVGLEIVGGLLLLAGFKTRWVAGALAAFSVATALIFHFDFADQNQLTAFLKNLAIAGGMLQVVAFGPGRLALDAR